VQAVCSLPLKISTNEQSGELETVLRRKGNANAVGIICSQSSGFRGPGRLRKVVEEPVECLFAPSLTYMYDKHHM
jgi:hypothetical protein